MSTGEGLDTRVLQDTLEALRLSALVRAEDAFAIPPAACRDAIEAAADEGYLQESGSPPEQGPCAALQHERVQLDPARDADADFG